MVSTILINSYLFPGILGLGELAFFALSESSNGNDSYTDDVRAFFYNADGTKAYWIEHTGNNNFYEVAVSPDYALPDTTVPTSDGTSGRTARNWAGGGFNGDGTKIFLGRTDAWVDEWTLTVAYDITSITTANPVATHDFGTVLGSATGFQFNEDGSKFWMQSTIGGSATSYSLNQWSLSTEYDLTSDSYDGEGPIPNNVFNDGFGIPPSGERVIFFNETDDQLTEYVFTTPGNATAGSTYDGIMKSYRSNFGGPTGIMFIDDDNIGIWIQGSTSGAFGKMTGYGNIGGLGNYWYNNDSADDSAGNTGSYAIIPATSSGDQSALCIDKTGTKVYFFADASSYDIEQFDLTTPWDVSSIVNAVPVIGIVGFSTRVRGLALNEDGSRIYGVVSGANPGLYYWDMSTEYDISTIGSQTQATIPSGATGPQSICWNADGTKVYLGQGNSVHQYTCAVAYEADSITFDQTGTSSGDRNTTYGMCWNEDGTNLYILDLNHPTWETNGLDQGVIIEYTGLDPYTIPNGSMSSYLSSPGPVQGYEMASNGQTLDMCGHQLGGPGPDGQFYTTTNASSRRLAQYRKIY